MSPAGRRGPGRRPGDPDTRGEILRAARTEFAERSFAGTTVRAVADRAGVDPALVHHYFGTKRELFTASLALRMDPEQLLARVSAAAAPERGTVLAREFFRVWDDVERRTPFVALIRSATTEPEAATMLRQFAEQLITPALRPLVTGADVDLRLQLAVSQLLGAAVLRHVVAAEPLASSPVETLVRRLGPAVQGHLDGP